MVKSLNDILKEIENQKPIVRNFANGGYDDDMGHDEDQAMGSGEFGGPEGAVTESDVAGLVAAGVLGEDEVEGFITQANNPDQSPTSVELANQQGDVGGSQSVTGIFAPAQYPNVSNFGGGKRENNLSKDSGVDDEYKGGFLESLIESLVYGLTLGAVDLEMSGKDAWGGDVSRMGKDQPVGVDVGLPGIFGPVGFVAPEIRYDANKGETTVGGGLPGAIQTAYNYITDDKSNETSSSVVAKGPPSTSVDNRSDPNFYGSEGASDVRDINRPTIDPSTEVVQAIIEEEEKEPDVYANLLSGLYTGAKSGGSIDAFSPGGLAGMMQRRQQLSPYHQFQQQQLYNQSPRYRGYNPYTGGSPNVPSDTYMEPPQRGMFGGFPRLGDQGSKDTQLKPETYFHEHEGGKVNYPNFPSQTSIEPATKRNPFKSSIVTPKSVPQPIAKQYVSEDLPSVTQEIATPLETPVAVEEEAAVEQQVTQPTSINIDMPQNVTATLEFPEEVVGTPQYNYKGGNVMRYNQGGLTGLASNNPEQYNLGGFLRGMIPALAGGAAMFTPLAGLGMNPWLVGGLSGAATGALTGGKQGKTVLGAAKNFLMGSSGASAIGTTAGVGQAGAGTVKGSLPAYEKAIKAGTFKADPVNWANVKSGFQGLMDAEIGDSLKALTGPLAGLGASMALTPPPTGGPPITPQQVAQMSPEQRNKFLQAQREKYPYQRSTFQPPNTGINFAADGGVMEIDEEMESGSFVLPADVVSNVGDGSSTSGHRRLAELFGGGDDYAIGGGILKGPIKGPGGGLDDLIQTGIDGVRVARLSTDEFVVPKDVVRKIGDGSQKAGAEQLYDFMKNVRLNKHGTSQQPKGINMAGLKKMV